MLRQKIIFPPQGVFYRGAIVKSSWQKSRFLSPFAFELSISNGFPDCGPPAGALELAMKGILR